MMKELKVRIWDEDNKWFEYPDTLELNIGLEYQLFTGRRDKSGKDIYEGDIVAASIYSDEKPQILEVEFRNGAFVIDYEDSESDVVNIGEFVGSLEIIGNIYNQANTVERTALGKRLAALRAKAIDAGMRLLTEEEVLVEVKRRRGS